MLEHRSDGRATCKTAVAVRRGKIDTDSAAISVPTRCRISQIQSSLPRSLSLGVDFVEDEKSFFARARARVAGLTGLRKPRMYRRSMPFLYRKMNRSGVGCHDLGVCDKVVLDLHLSSFRNRPRLGLHEISLIHMIDRRHGLVADSKTSKTVAPIS